MSEFNSDRQMMLQRSSMNETEAMTFLLEKFVRAQESAMKSMADMAMVGLDASAQHRLRQFLVQMVAPTVVSLLKYLFQSLDMMGCNILCVALQSLLGARMQDTTTKYLGLVKQHRLTLHQPSQLGQMRNWDNMDGVQAILEPRHCWTAYTKMNEKVQVTDNARVETIADVALMSSVTHLICITFVSIAFVLNTDTQR